MPQSSLQAMTTLRAASKTCRRIAVYQIVLAFVAAASIGAATGNWALVVVTLFGSIFAAGFWTFLGRLGDAVAAIGDGIEQMARR